MSYSSVQKGAHVRQFRSWDQIIDNLIHIATAAGGHRGVGAARDRERGRAGSPIFQFPRETDPVG